MTTRSGISASIASSIALLVKAGGTKAMETSAPVSAIASATVAKTGSSTGEPSAACCSTVVPALRAFTPPTTWVPALSMRAVCLVPSPPVMPWTMTLESLLRKIDIVFVLRLLRGQFGGLVGALVHGECEGDQRVVRLGQDASALLDVVAVETHHQRLVGLVAQDLERLHDAVRDRVARGDAAEDVHEHALDLRVVENDIEPRSHHLGGGTAADVEEVRRLDALVLLASVGDDVQRRHDESRTVSDDADLAVQLHVVEVGLLGLGLQGVRLVTVLESLVIEVAEARILVEGHLAVEGDDVALLGEHQ